MTVRQIECAVVACDGPDCLATLEFDYESTLHLGKSDGSGLDLRNMNDWLGESDWWAPEQTGKHYCQEHWSVNEEGEKEPVREHKENP